MDIGKENTQDENEEFMNCESLDPRILFEEEENNARKKKPG